MSTRFMDIMARWQSRIEAISTATVHTMTSGNRCT